MIARNDILSRNEDGYPVQLELTDEGTRDARTLYLLRFEMSDELREQARDQVTTIARMMGVSEEILDEHLDTTMEQSNVLDSLIITWN